MAEATTTHETTDRDREAIRELQRRFGGEHVGDDLLGEIAGQVASIDRDAGVRVSAMGDATVAGLIGELYRLLEGMGVNAGEIMGAIGNAGTSTDPVGAMMELATAKGNAEMAMNAANAAAQTQTMQAEVPQDTGGGASDTTATSAIDADARTDGVSAVAEQDGAAQDAAIEARYAEMQAAENKNEKKPDGIEEQPVAKSAEELQRAANRHDSGNSVGLGTLEAIEAGRAAGSNRGVEKESVAELLTRQARGGDGAELKRVGPNTEQELDRREQAALEQESGLKR